MATAYLKEIRERLELLPIGELRSQATKNYGIKLTRESTKEDIINMIVGIMSKGEFARQATGDLPDPGWARIHVQPIQGRNNFPFYVNTNGYECFIPFNVLVDVPIKVLGTLDNAIEMRVSQDENGNRTDSYEASYVYSLKGLTEGPDPRPGFEVQRELMVKAKRDFAEKHGYWPKNRAAMETPN